MLRAAVPPAPYPGMWSFSVGCYMDFAVLPSALCYLAWWAQPLGLGVRVVRMLCSTEPDTQLLQVGLVFSPFWNLGMYIPLDLLTPLSLQDNGRASTSLPQALETLLQEI